MIIQLEAHMLRTIMLIVVMSMPVMWTPLLHMIQMKAMMMMIVVMSMLVRVLMSMTMLVMVRMGCCTCHGDSDGRLDKTSDAFFLIASVYWSLIYMNY